MGLGILVANHYEDDEPESAHDAEEIEHLE